MSHSWQIIIGLLIGVVLGILNTLILRWGVHCAMRAPGQVGRGTALVVCSYLARYALIALSVYALLRKGFAVVAVAALCVLGVLTIVLAIFQKKRANQPAKD